MKVQIGVIGSEEVDSEFVLSEASKAGREIALNNGILVCGGLTGVMEASAKGAKEAGGLTVGIIPGMEKKEANRYIDVVVATGIGYARNTIIATTSDALIVLAGGPGTLSEVAFALNLGKPVVAVKNTGGVADLFANKEIDGRRVISATSATEAVRLVIRQIKNKK